MISAAITALIIFALSGIFWYLVFYRREKKLLDRLQNMIDAAANGSLNRTEISETKYSALENSLKQYLDSSVLSDENRSKEKAMIQSLISDIAHQTLTPISNLKLYGQILSEQSEKNEYIIETIGEQTDKLEFLIDSLVKLSRLETGIISVCPRKTEISALFDQVKNEYEAKAAAKSISLIFQDTRLTAHFDLKWSAEAIGNIVDNAIKYTHTGGQVAIKVEKYSFFVRIDIADNGIGIKEEEIPKIFKRFYRSVDAADIPGVGIGLHLARTIIHLQSGYIKVISQPQKGSVFSVFLPV